MNSRENSPIKWREFIHKLELHAEKLGVSYCASQATGTLHARRLHTRDKNKSSNVAVESK
jgi:hypothetical protein